MTKSPAQIFHELTCKHRKEYKSCKECPLYSLPIIEYSNAADILNRMKEFCGEEGYYNFTHKIVLVNTGYIDIDKFLDKYILNPSALLQKAIEFLEEGK